MNHEKPSVPSATSGSTHPRRATPGQTGIGLASACLGQGWTHFFAWSWLVFGVIGLPLWGLDPAKTIAQYGHDRWTTQNGLPGEAVYQILQDRHGYLWLRTSSALVRFDGVHFDDIQIPPPYKNSVRAICLNPEGDLVVRGWQDTLLLRDNEVSYVLPTVDLPEGGTQTVHITKDDQLWVGTDNVLYLKKGDVMIKAVRALSLVSTFLADRKGRLWIGTYSGLYEYANGEMIRYPNGFQSSLVEPAPWLKFKTAGAAQIGNISTLAQDAEGTLLIGTDLGLYQLRGDAVHPLAEATELAGKQITALLSDRQGNLWVGTSTAGLFRRSRGLWSHLTVADGLNANGILSLQEDKEGSLWIGTTAGLDRLKDTKLTTFTSNEGLVGDRTRCMLQGQDGAIYIWCSGAGLTRMKDGETVSFAGKNGLPLSSEASLFEDKRETLWIGTFHGLCRLQGNEITTYTAGGKLSDLFIAAIAEDDQGLIITTSAGPAYRFKDDIITPYTINGAETPLSTPGHYTPIIYRDAEQTLWFGTMKGLYKYPLRGSEGMVLQRGIEFPVFTLHDDNRGELWITGAIDGLIRLRRSDGRIVHYTAADGLFHNEIGHVLHDGEGNLWMSTPRGLFTVSRQDLDDFAEGRRAQVKSAVYDVADGMKTSEFSGLSHQPAGCRTRDGKLWFTTQKGVVMVDLQHFPRNELVPTVLIESIVRDGTVYRPKKLETFKSGSEKWEFHYTTLSLREPTRVQFKYKLEGYDRDWVSAGGRRVAYYTRLPPGHYEFRVMGSNDDGVWNEAGAAVAFFVAPRIYQTAWFISFAGAAVVGCFIALHRLRLKALRNRQAELQRVVDDRTRSLQQEILIRQKAEAEAERVHKDLMVASHQAGMAEIAIGVLHNVGNVLNSVNVSATFIADLLRTSRVGSLARAVSLLEEHRSSLAEFLTHDERGKQVITFLKQLSQHLNQECASALSEATELQRRIEHIKGVVAMQQTYATLSGVVETATVDEMVDDAIKINAASLTRNNVQLLRELPELPPMNVEKHRVLQILVNMISNAEQACRASTKSEKRVVVRAAQQDDRIRIMVTDNGIGILPENLTRIFTQGFTTRKDGHGFGLHSSALAATILGGSLTAHSEGPEKGAEFMLDLPIQSPRCKKPARSGGGPTPEVKTPEPFGIASRGPQPGPF